MESDSLGVILGLMAIFLSVVFPMGGIIFGSAVIIFEKKTNILAILGISLGFVGFAMHYIYLPTDDMFRYVAYMNSIQSVNGISEFVSQIYSTTPVSEYGLNGQTWPLSAVLLFIISKTADYRILSAVTVVLSIFVRLFAIAKVTETDKVDALIIFIRMFGYFSLIFMMTLRLPVSGFRWYVATDIVILLMASDVLNKELITIPKLFWSVVAGLFHPAAWIYLGIKVFAAIGSSGNNSFVKRWLPLFAVVALGVVVVFHSSFVGNVLNQFAAYVSGDSFSGTFEWMRKFYVGWFIIVSLMFSRFYLIRQDFSKANLYNVEFNYLVTGLSLPFFLFQRIYPFEWVMLTVFWIFSVVKTKKFTYIDLAVVILTLVIGITYYWTAPGNFLPPTDLLSYGKMLITPIWR
ncbi:hypothetical protein FGL85_04210 [Leuconostoc pseudomesenteroides]|uniref:Uncharacterized protein n=1 Tax=Leuconostoc pseudomesenteroides TaxID=33968 RepID=A0A5B8SXR9_LEUPS|nr:hypothetical protein [Leuconostoc pseudomesenteroides]QEA41749.1 hypothetical protein FGL85_04210 [Leuconostoc pseudomesenteroides]